MEKHIRKNKLKLTFTDQLGKAVSVSQDEDSEISSKKEAKKLAFYLFWNMRATLSRFGPHPVHLLVPYSVRLALQNRQLAHQTRWSIPACPFSRLLSLHAACGVVCLFSSRCSLLPKVARLSDQVACLIHR